MKLLAIAGSPRRGGNTDQLLQEFLKGAAEAGAECKILAACDLEIEGCRNCDACLEKGQCIIQDDMQMVYKEMEAADRLVIASPLHFMSVPAQLKALVDRCQALWVRKYILKVPPLGDTKTRKGFLISVGGRRNLPTLFDAEKVTIKALFKILDISYSGELLIAETDAKGAILQNPQALQKAFDEGRQLIINI